MISRRLTALTAAVFLVVPGIFLFKGPNDKPLVPEQFIKEADTIQMETGGRPYTLKRNGKTWILKTEGTSFACREGEVDLFIKNLSGLKILKIAGESKDVWADLGVQNGNGFTTTIINGNRKIELIWGKETEGGSRIFVRRENCETVYISDFPGDSIYADRWYWADLRILPQNINTDNVIAVKYSKNGMNYSIYRENGWILRTDVGTASINPVRTEALINRIAGFKGESARQEKSAEVLEGAGTVTVVLSGGKIFTLKFYKSEESVFFVGSNSKSGYLFKTSAAEMKSIFPDLKFILDNY